MSDRDELKLPKWVQRELAVLRKQLAEAREELAIGPEDSTVFENPHGVPRPLGTDPIIEFLEGGSGGPAKGRLTVQRSRYGAGLMIHGSDLVSVAPKAANSIVVTVDQ